MMLALAVAAVVQLGAGQGTDSIRATLLAAEDARAATPAQRAQLLAGLEHPDTLIQQQAVRALGRLERPDLAGAIAGRLGGAAASVRIEAANALAQAYYRVNGAPALDLLRGRAAAETDPVVRGAVLAAAGRLRLAPGSAGSREADLMLADALAADGGHLPGALRGTWDFIRRQGRTPAVSAGLRAQLRRRAASVPEGLPRRLAVHAALLAGEADDALLATALRSSDPQLRRLAAMGARTAPSLTDRLGLVRRALDDSLAMVRIEGIRGWVAHGRAAAGCAPLVAATSDPAAAVQLLAIEALGAGCGPVGPPVDLLESIAGEPLTADRWQRPAAAIVALAGADSARAAIRLGRFESSPVWWARAAAARAAGRLADTALLLRLTSDPVDNVRTAALEALRPLSREAADRAALEQLRSRQDLQLLLTAARGLAGSPPGSPVGAVALEAFERVTARRAETSRDTRMALLDRLAEYGTPDLGRRLARSRDDFDPLVAARVVEVAGRLTGEALAAPAGQARAPRPLPPPAELRQLRRAVITMEGGGRIEVELRAGEAPASVARFARMIREGWFAGLTFHRVVPNFVVQGGSPGANEYEGGGEFSRDEVGGSHLRGTVGISTRGRDTGDGQIFINLVDNLNLDHEYTVIGQVVGGWEVLDRLLEGAVMARVELGPVVPRP